MSLSVVDIAAIALDSKLDPRESPSEAVSKTHVGKFGNTVLDAGTASVVTPTSDAVAAAVHPRSSQKWLIRKAKTGLRFEPI